MESGEQTQDEALARSRLELAKQELDKGHLERAEECAKEALEFDGQLNEARIWLADLYIAQAEPYLASRQLQDAIYTDRTDSIAWEKLKEVDPISAARMARLSELAPDPFVSHRVAELEDEFEDLGSEEEEAEEEYEEGSPWAGVTGAGQAAAELLEDFSDDEEETAEDDEDLEPEADSDHEVEVEAVAEITPATPRLRPRRRRRGACRPIRAPTTREAHWGRGRGSLSRIASTCSAGWPSPRCRACLRTCATSGGSTR